MSHVRKGSRSSLTWRPKHSFRRVMLVSGDRENEVRYADRVGIKEVFASQSPEQKLDLVRRETLRDKTVYLGDGINRRAGTYCGDRGYRIWREQRCLVPGCGCR